MSKHGQAPILLAVDFSPDSEAAFVWATRTARCFGAPLVVLHVVHDPESAPGSYSGTSAAGHLLTMEQAAQGLLASFLERMKADPRVHEGLETSSRMTSGLPPNRILEVAEELGAQLIVMGSKGRTGLEHVLLGSKAQRVAQLSPIPVTIVKRDQLDC